MRLTNARRDPRPDPRSDQSIVAKDVRVRDALGGAPRSPSALAPFVAEDGDVLVGFVEVGVRSHASGCYAMRPIGYLEEWYVAEDARRRGVGAALVHAAEDWARSQGCVEMASDTGANVVSQHAHAALGFERADPEPLVAFRKQL